MIKFNEPFVTGKEQEYIIDCFNRGHFYGNGFYTKKCQEKITDTLGLPDVLLTDSCTSALEICALLIRKWGTEQEVILPSYTFSSTASAFARAGFKLVFAEIDPTNMMLDINSVSDKISDKTAAIVVVHYGGWAADLASFRNLCDQNNLILVEDAAQAFGCVQKNKHIGSFGDLSCFSFHETKNIHCGLGGCLVVNNKDYISRAVHIWERGTNRQEVLKGLADKYSWVEIGGSFYPTEMQAAFLLAQLESLAVNLSQRREVFQGYYDYFESNEITGFYYPKLLTDFETNFHAFWVMFDSISECDFVREALQMEGIAAYIGYVPLHSSKVGRALGNKPDDLPLTEEYSQRILRLPLHNNMTAEESNHVAKRLHSALKVFRNEL